MQSSLKLLQWSELNEKQICDIDQFIMKNSTNGEFINTYKFLSYHPKGRFLDDSIVIVDGGSGYIRAVMMAAQKKDEPYTVVSHPGTTFAGPVIEQNGSISLVEDVLDMILSYYEKKYKEIEIKLTPQYYTDQPNAMPDLGSEIYVNFQFV